MKHLISDSLKNFSTKISDTMVVGATGSTVYTNVPNTTTNPLINEIVKIIVGIVSALVSHFLINLFNRKSEGKV